MKIFPKYTFLLVLSIFIACGNTSEPKEVKKLPSSAKKRDAVLVKKPEAETTSKEVSFEEDNTPPIKKKVEKSNLTSRKEVGEKISQVVERDQTEKTTLDQIASKPSPALPERIEKAKTEMPEKKKLDPKPIQRQDVTEQTTSEVKKEALEADKPVAVAIHDAWNNLLQKYVSSTGKVNYKGLKRERAALNAYLQSLSDNFVQDDWSKAKKMAYWINVYNAFTIKMIVDNYPISSITKLHRGKPWDIKWIKLGDETYSLNNIEHDILRPQFQDARVHFAVNCAAQSCPPILNKAWTAKNLEQYLDRQARAFINNAAFNKITTSEVVISKIFEWYAEDFGDIINYLNKFTTTKIEVGAKVGFQEYNWALNE